VISVVTVTQVCQLRRLVCHLGVCVCILASAIENWRFYLQTPVPRNCSLDGATESAIQLTFDLLLLLNGVKSSKINVIFTPVNKGTNLPERPRVLLYT